MTSSLLYLIVSPMMMKDMPMIVTHMFGELAMRFVKTDSSNDHFWWFGMKKARYFTAAALEPDWKFEGRFDFD